MDISCFFPIDLIRMDLSWFLPGWDESPLCPFWMDPWRYEPPGMIIPPCPFSPVRTIVGAGCFET